MKSLTLEIAKRAAAYKPEGPRRNAMDTAAPQGQADRAPDRATGLLAKTRCRDLGQYRHARTKGGRGMRPKVLRVITGQTGIMRRVARVMVAFRKPGRRNRHRHLAQPFVSPVLKPAVLENAGILARFWIIGGWCCRLVTWRLHLVRRVQRIRHKTNPAVHGAVEFCHKPLHTARTTFARPLERPYPVPCRVHYSLGQHLENFRSHSAAPAQPAKVQWLGSGMIPRNRQAYAPYEELIGPARDRPEIWRLLLGVAVCVLVTIGLTRAMMELIRRNLPDRVYTYLLEGFDHAATPAGLLFLLMLMVPLGIGAIVATEVVHRRKALTLFGPLPLAVQQFGRVTAALVLVTLVIALLPPWPFTHDTQPGLAPTTWLTLLPFTLGAILLQITCEELAFRGYLQTELAVRFGHPLIWMGVPSALFALGHHAPDAFGANAWLVTFWAFAFGMAAADLTARSGSLGPALALHFVNNFSALAITSLAGDMSGLALNQMPFGPQDSEALRAWIPVDLAMIGISWLAARVALRV